MSNPPNPSEPSEPSDQSEASDQSDRQPADKSGWGRLGGFFLMLAPIPVAFLLFEMPGLNEWTPGLVTLLGVLVLGCCLYGSIKLCNAARGGCLAVALGLILAIIFIAIDSVVILFAGCSIMGR